MPRCSRHNVKEEGREKAIGVVRKRVSVHVLMYSLAAQPPMDAAVSGTKQGRSVPPVTYIGKVSAAHLSLISSVWSFLRVGYSKSFLLDLRQ